MTTITQCLHHKLKPKIFKWKRQALQNCPHKAGKCERVFTKDPKKPCSARRAVTYVTLRNKKYVLCKIPGETHKTQNKLAKFSQVLVRGGRVLDLPGTKYKLVFTKKSKCASLRPLDFRVKARSKFGVEYTGRTKHLRLTRGPHEKLIPTIPVNLIPLLVNLPDRLHRKTTWLDWLFSLHLGEYLLVTGLLILLRNPIKKFIIFLWKTFKALYNSITRCIEYYKNTKKKQ